MWPANYLGCGSLTLSFNLTRVRASIIFESAFHSVCILHSLGNTSIQKVSTAMKHLVPYYVNTEATKNSTRTFRRNTGTAYCLQNLSMK